MMSQILASTNNSLPQNDQGGKKPRDDAEMTLRACKRCGEIGHMSKECHEQCPYRNMNHPIGECPMTQVTCFLCEGINHVPAECMLAIAATTSSTFEANRPEEDRLFGIPPFE
jgi:hypothetical protein